MRQISWLVLSKIFLFIIWKKIVLRFGRTNLLYRQFFAVSFHDILSESRNKMSNNFTFLSISTLINTEWHPYSRRTASDSNKRHRRRPQECHRRRLFFWNKTNTIDWYRSEHCESRSVRNARLQSDPFGFARLKAGMLLFYMENALLLNQDRIR